MVSQDLLVSMFAGNSISASSLPNFFHSFRNFLFEGSGCFSGGGPSHAAAGLQTAHLGGFRVASLKLISEAS